MAKPKNRRATAQRKSESAKARREKPAPKKSSKKSKDDEYDNDMRGVLFLNKDKEEGDNRPHYKGSAEIDGEKFWVAGWKKKSKQGKPFVSLSFEPQEEIEDEDDEDEEVEEDDFPID